METTDLLNYISFKSKYFRLTPIQSANLVRNLTGSFVCILAYSLLIYIVIIFPIDGDKAGSLASMFGFAATLFAPIGAFFLLDNWKSQIKYNEQMRILSEMIIHLKGIESFIAKTKSEQSNGLYFTEVFDYLYTPSGKVPSGSISIPDFTEIYKLIGNLENTKLLLELYSQEYNNIFINSDSSCSIQVFKEALLEWIRHFHLVKEKCINISSINDEQKFEIVDLACSCSSYFYYLRKEHLLGIGIPSHNECEIYYSPMQIRLEIVELRKRIEDLP